MWVEWRAEKANEEKQREEVLARMFYVQRPALTKVVRFQLPSGRSWMRGSLRVSLKWMAVCPSCHPRTLEVSVFSRLLQRRVENA